jgi:phosphocarrier protein HPr
MASKQAVVGSAIGLHARPAAIIADKAGEYDEDILLSKPGSDEEPVDAASPLMIMTLGAKKGDTVTIESENATAVDEIAALVESDLDQE